jgi:hypothetical protein
VVETRTLSINPADTKVKYADVGLTMICAAVFR